MNENGLLAIYIAFLLVAGITTGTAMNNYWGRAENDAYIGIIALTGMAFVVAVLAGNCHTWNVEKMAALLLFQFCCGMCLFCNRK